MSTVREPRAVAGREAPLPPGLDLKEIVERIYRLIPAVVPFHSPGGDLHAVLNQFVKAYFTGYRGNVLDLAPFGGIVWPYVGMGNVSSHDLFNLDELILFSFYAANRDRYHTAFDIGANLGLHSIVLSRLGYVVHAFEPDPAHYEWFVKNTAANGCSNVRAIRKAVSDRSGVTSFVRVKDNTSASHIAGSREFYGDVEYLEIETIALQDLDVEPDLIKIDTEGHEKTVLLSIDLDQWQRVDAIAEVQHADNARAIFEHFHGTGVNVFAQSLGWRTVDRLEDMPRTNKEGHIFISRKPAMPWAADGAGVPA